MKWIDEFKQFISRGNVMDMAVGIIIGGAFTAIVTSLVEKIINPIITLISGGGNVGEGWRIPVGDSGQFVDFGAFIAAIINFLLIAFVVFWLVKTVNGIKSKVTSPKEEEVKPTCPACLEEIKEGATRCPHCTAIIGNVDSNV
ncbi:MAG: large conductance mechanosensitive channel protein MscL [Neisseriaceae bacterium]|nr:large conductance mechanosensitive channel protein MscL [Neisseriaceae bacterium]